ncbi:hypothetical protein BH24CHL6_BH24CHL6_11150 [soil metagenome]
MIPTTTYDQIRLEQQNQLARLELRQHERAAREHRSTSVQTHRVRAHLVTAKRAAAAAGAILVTTAIALFV